MADQLQIRGGNTADNATFTGAQRELSIDTVKNQIIVHDGATVGGHPVAPQNNPEFTGTASHPLGSAAAPTITFTGDANTGIYSPGIDQVAITTAGTGRLYVNSSGNVGIGTTSPGESLSLIEGTALGWNDTSGNNAARIYATSGDELRFERGSTNSRSMTIDSSGNVGIGDSSPDRKLQIINSTDALMRLGRSDASSHGSTDVEIKFAKDYYSNAVFEAASHRFEIQGTEKMRIDSSGKLLVGTSSVGVSSTVVLQGRSGVTTGEAILRLCRGQDTPADGATLGDLSFGDSNNGDAARIFASRDGGTWTSASSRPSRLVFSTTSDNSASPTEAMRIGSDQSIRTYASATALALSTAAAAGTTVALIWGRYSATAVNTGTTSFYVWSNGNVQNTNNSYTAISDIKLKENIVDANSQWNDLKALRVRNYNLKEGQTHKQIGLVAQEVEPISPGLVYETPDRDAEGNDLGTVTKSVNYSVLYMKAVKALQEAMERIEQLETEMAEVKAQLQAS
jgi:hypothetical protein